MLREPHPVKMKFDTTLPDTWALSKCKRVLKSFEIVCPHSTHIPQSHKKVQLQTAGGNLEN